MCDRMAAEGHAEKLHCSNYERRAEDGQGGEEVGKRPTVKLKWADLGDLPLLNVLFSCRSE